MTLPVAFVCDRGYLPWCATALRSCADTHAPGEIDLHLLHDGSLTAGDVDDLHRTLGDFPLSIHPIAPAQLAHLPDVDRFGRIVWARFLLPELLPEADRVLYLDADVYVVDHLSELADLALGDAVLGAVRNVVPEASQRRMAALGLTPDGILNSGVLLMPLDRMRAERFTDQVTAVAQELADRIVWPDQDVLNVVCAGRWYPLHPRYNAQNSFFDWREQAAAVLGETARVEATTSPAIVHFEGPSTCKPWHILCRHPWRDRYRATLDRTAWAGTDLDDDQVATRLIGRLPAAWQLPVYRGFFRARARLRQRRSSPS